jgi:D-alanyl-D-alanine carboxypeptidase (penicillin-binding protein 5/6)
MIKTLPYFFERMIAMSSKRAASPIQYAAIVSAVFTLLFAGVADSQQRQTPPRGGPPPRNAPAQAPAPPANPLQPETTARQAIIVDTTTGTVLFEKNADERMPPSSMSKIMTMYLVFEALKKGDLKLEDALPVSERAWRIQGSKMFVPLGERVKVEDLLRGVIVQSGNDACIVLAEGLAGTEEAFADRMNVVAKRIGLTGSNFRNASGWPHKDHYMTARDLMILGSRLIADFPEYYGYYKEKDFTFGKDEKGTPIRQGNRNPLLYKNTGADGIKTGHTDEAGYGLTSSAIRDGRRVVMVMNGWPSMRARTEESERLLEWAYREWGTYVVFKRGEAVDSAQIWLGQQPSVTLVPQFDAAIALPRRIRPQLDVKTQFDSPVAAPIVAGTRVGSVTMSAPGYPTVEVPLVAETSVERLGLFARMGAVVSHYIFGKRS